MARKNPFEGEVSKSLSAQHPWKYSRLPDPMWGRGIQRPFDFLLLMSGRVAAIEAKQTANRISLPLSSLFPHQHESLGLVEALGHEAYVAINFRNNHSPRLNEAYLIPYQLLVKTCHNDKRKSIRRTRLKEVGMALKRIKLPDGKAGWDFKSVLKGRGMTKAIPTYYKGLCYKSRLEAQTALLLDAMGLEYTYEEKSFLLPVGAIPYTPDFHIESHKLWVEARGYKKKDSEQQLEQFALGLPDGERLVRISPDKMGGVAVWGDGGWEPVAIVARKGGADFVTPGKGFSIKVTKSTIQIQYLGQWVDPLTALHIIKADLQT